MTFGCHDAATSFETETETETLIKKMAGEMEMMISLYNVLLYLQLQLDILSQTYSLVQRRGRALYLLCLKGFFTGGDMKVI